MKYFWALVLLAVSNSVGYAEIYQGIEPYTSLRELKEKYPNATFTRNKPAWEQKEDALFSISGVGLSGEIMVKLSDCRPVLASAVRTRALKMGADPALFENAIQSIEEDDALKVDWVRWVPVSPIPYQRFVLKYGEPQKSGFGDDDMQPFRGWTRGIIAHLTDNLKDVVFVDYGFTKTEQDRAGGKLVKEAIDKMAAVEAEEKEKAARAHENAAIEKALAEGNVLYESGKPAEAIAVWTDVLKRDPENTVAADSIAKAQADLQAQSETPDGADEEVRVKPLVR